MILNRISFGQIQSFAAIAHISPKSMNLLFIFILFLFFFENILNLLVAWRYILLLSYFKYMCINKIWLACY